MVNISIILCTYNRLKQLKVSIESILTQSFDEYELIVVNDGSSDGTEEYLACLSNGEINIKILNNKSNLGLQKSLNLALQISSAPLIARIDDDDEWLDKNKLKKQYNEFALDSNLVLLGTSFEINGEIKNNPIKDSEIRKQILFRCPFQHSTVVFKRKVNNILISYNEGLVYAEDWELWLRLGQEGTMRNLIECTTKIAHENNMSETYFVKQLKGNRRMVFPFLRSYPKANLAYIYHIFIYFFFTIIPINSFIHKLFQWIFNFFFKMLN